MEEKKINKNYWYMLAIAIIYGIAYLIFKRFIIILVALVLIYIFKPLKHIHIGGWHYYLGKRRKKLNSFSGKWMYFFNNKRKIRKLCRKAILDGVVCECKHSMAREGVACFYVSATDLVGQINIIDFMLSNEMIKHKNDGSLYNIAFKFDIQTRKKKYGKKFKAELTLDKFIDLTTGEFFDIEVIYDNTKMALEEIYNDVKKDEEKKKKKS